MRRRKRNQKQVKIVIGTIFCLLLIMTVGYAAFSTNLTLTAKGNIKDVYHTVKFKTQLLENNDFADGLNGWSSTGATVSVDNDMLYENNKAIKIVINATSYQGVRFAQKVNYKKNTTYEYKAHLYRDDSLVSGAKNRSFRIFSASYIDETQRESWNRYITVNETNMNQKEWKEVSAEFKTSPTSTATYFIFQMDFQGNENYATVNQIAAIWVALPSFYEVQKAEVKKYNKIGTLPVATKEGYTFIGWYTEEFGGEMITENTEINKDSVYYARFTKNT